MFLTIYVANSDHTHEKINDNIKNICYITPTISTTAIATNVINALIITSNNGDLYFPINNATTLNVAMNEIYSTITFPPIFYANNAAPNAIGNADSRNILRAKILYPDFGSTTVIDIK